MSQELLNHALLHDLRGSATALMGWQSLLDPPDQKAVVGIERTVDALIATIRLYGSHIPRLADVSADVSVIAGLLGIDFEGEEDEIALCPHRLEAALELASPSRLTMNSLSEGRFELILYGLPKEGLALLATLQSHQVVAVTASGGRVLGTCLFKEVVRGRRCEYVISTDDGTLRLLANPSKHSWSSPDDPLEDRCVES